VVDTQAGEAASYYTSVFKNSRIVNVAHYTEAGPGNAGSLRCAAPPTASRRPDRG